ncbi:MAG: permease [Chloroflexi bacterium]|nr:permease [Chloroflexota bacterium]
MNLSIVRSLRRPRLSLEALTWSTTIVLLLAGSLLPEVNIDMLKTVGRGLVSLLPVVAVAALLAGSLTVGRWSDRSLAWLKGGPVRTVVIASFIGAITPVCGLGVLPLIVTLLRRGVTIAPVMAFWLSSPVTDPSMFLITAGIIGVPFAIAKTVSAFGIGLIAGAVTGMLPGYRGAGYALMRPEVLKQYECEEDEARFWPAVWGSARPIMQWLALALVLEVFLQRLVPHEWVMSFFGSGTGASIPLAVFVGAPMYLDGYAALPLVRGLLEMGMSFGAALALMISGAAVSLYAAAAVISIVHPRVFVLYALLALIGACLAGYVANWLL